MFNMKHGTATSMHMLYRLYELYLMFRLYLILDTVRGKLHLMHQYTEILHLVVNSHIYLLLLYIAIVFQVLRPLEPLRPLNTEFLVYVKDLYTCTLTRLKAADIDQEVKERAISCMGRLLCNTGDSLISELSVGFLGYHHNLV